MIHLLVSLGGLLIGLFQKHMANKHEQQQLLLRASIKDVKDARLVNDDWFKWTRRVIALMAMSYIFVAPTIASFYGIPIWFGYVEENGLLTSFFKGDDDIIWKQLPSGFVIGPIQMYIAEAIIALYFGRK